MKTEYENHYLSNFYKPAVNHNCYIEERRGGHLAAPTPRATRLADRRAAARGRLVCRTGWAVAIKRGIHTGQVVATLWPGCALLSPLGGWGESRRCHRLPLRSPQPRRGATTGRSCARGPVRVASRAAVCTAHGWLRASEETRKRNSLACCPIRRMYMILMLKASLNLNKANARTEVNNHANE
jgi:hypothetical protein